MIDVAFRNILLADSEVAALAVDRVFFDLRPQDQRQPSIVLNLISATPGMTFQGRGGYVSGRMQVNCLAPTKADAKDLAQAARDALDGFNGTNDSTTIGYILTQTFKDIPAMPLQGAGTAATFGVSVDALFLYME